MERKLEHGRHPELPHLNPNIPRGNQGDELRHLERGREAATEFASILRLLIKKIKIARNKPQIRQWWYDVMTLRPPPLPKHEEKYREDVEEGWQETDWAITMPQVINEILQKYSTSIRNPTVTRTSYVADGMQWIRMKKLGKALTNKCRAVRELPNKKTQKTGRDQRQKHE